MNKKIVIIGIITLILSNTLMVSAKGNNDIEIEYKLKKNGLIWSIVVGIRIPLFLVFHF